MTTQKTLVGKTLCCLAFCFMGLPLALLAESYELAADKTDAISTNVAYSTMTVNGDLTVRDGAVVTVPTVTMTGGSLTVTGSGTTFGENRSGETSTRTTYTLSPAAGGAYPLLSAENSGALKIYSATVAAGGAGTDGVFDILNIDSATAYVRWLNNDSSLTGRVTFAGSAASLTRQGKMASGTENAIFTCGAWLLALDNGVSATIDVGNQKGILNANGVSVRTTGTGDLTIKDSSDTQMVFNNGAVFDHAGALVLSRSSGSTLGKFRFAAGASIGPNVTRVETGTSKVSLEVADGTVINVKDFDFSKDECTVIGDGRIVVDGSAARTFKAAILSDSALTLEKTGVAELIVSSTTNIPTLVVGGGTVRITNDCTIGALTLAEGATLVIDGATVHTGTFDNAGGAVSYLNGGTLDFHQTVTDGETEEVRNWTMNGGTGFVKEGAGTLHLYDPAVTGLVHVAEGTLSFSRHGLLDKYFHLVFKEQCEYKAGDIGEFYLRRWMWYAPNAATYISSPRSPEDYSSAGEGATPAELTPGQVTCRKNVDPFVVKYRQATSGAYSYVTNDYQYIHWNFIAAGTSGRLCYYESCSLTNAADEASWLHLWVRLPDMDKYADGIDGFNSWVDYGGGNLTAWTIESSATGEDGTWKTVSDVSGYVPVNKYNLANGDDTKPQAQFSYTQQGVRNLADTLAVQVDSGATLDFTAKTGGQTVDRIVYDISKGGGTLKNVAVAAAGVLEIIDAGGALNYNQPLPLVFDGASDTGNFTNWTVTVNGSAVNRKLVFQSGALAFEQRGMIITFK